MRPFICTHSGRFHTDDVFAVATLKLLSRFANAIIVRSRDPSVIAEADIVVDVGFAYDPDRERFDHHQMPRPTAPEGYPYSALGLIWRHYAPLIANEFYSTVTPEIRTAAVKKLALGFVRTIDLDDNGLGAGTDASLMTAIEALNASSTDDETQLRAFNLAVDFAQKVIAGLLEQAITIEIDRAKLAKAVARHTDEINATGIFTLDRNMQWRDYVHDHNRDPSRPRIDFVVEPRSDGSWGLCATTIAANSFVSYRLLPDNIRGRTPEEITNASGVEGVIFAHANGFYACGDKTAMLRLASMSVPDPRYIPSAQDHDHSYQKA